MGQTASLDNLLQFATDLAAEAGAITLERFGPRLDAEDKSDGSPVTEVDRRVETFLRERIAAAFPSHAISGEEFPEKPASGPGPVHRWFVDPIDGTRSYIHGVPLYGVMIALEIDGAPTLGVIRHPAMGETVAAATGLGCHFNGARCRVSGTADLARATLLSSGQNFDTLGRSDAWRRLRAAVGMHRTWGDCYGYTLVATGRADVMIDPTFAVYDAAPLLPIITEAGGRFTDLTGQATIRGGSGVATNGPLHDRVLAFFSRG
ncbi:MAG: Histidinol-phosphatase [Phycisphaerae bacterium]|nr:Histidinol-phosphatase [Phycisphaerae bacterium]